MNINEEFIGQTEVAVLLGVTDVMVLYMTREQRLLKRHRRGGKICYRLADVLALRAARANHVKAGRKSGREILERRFAEHPELVEVG